MSAGIHLFMYIYPIVSPKAWSLERCDSCNDLGQHGEW